MSARSQSLRFILSLRMISSYITSTPVLSIPALSSAQQNKDQAQYIHKTIGATINNDSTTTEQPPYDGQQSMPLGSVARVCKQPIIALYFESENELKFYNLEASSFHSSTKFCTTKQGPSTQPPQNNRSNNKQ